MKVTLIIHTKIVLITAPETWVWEKKTNRQIQNSEFAGWLANWCRLGYELSVVNITTDVVWIPSNWLIADDIQDREIVQSIYLLELFFTYLPDLPILIFFGSLPNWESADVTILPCWPHVTVTIVLECIILHCTITYLNRRWKDNITIVYWFIFDFLFNLWLKHNAVYLYHHTQ